MPETCYYELLGVPLSASDSDIRSAYRREALLHHPDKNPDDPRGAEELFKKIRHAYSVLSDPHERAWYDAHKEQILSGGDGTWAGDATNQQDEEEKSRRATKVNLFKYMSSAAYHDMDDGAKGFYAVYRHLFNELDSEEQTAATDAEFEPAPDFGKSDSDWPHVKLFYAHWENFSTIKKCTFADKWNTSDVGRYHRRLMEKENKVGREKVRKEFNTQVRELVAFVKKRDERVAKQKELEQLRKLHAEHERLASEKAQARKKQEELEQRRTQRAHLIDHELAHLDEILQELDDLEQAEKEQRKSKKKNKKKNKKAGSGSQFQEQQQQQRQQQQQQQQRQNDGEGEEDGDEDLQPDAGEADVDQSDDYHEDLVHFCAACKKQFRSEAQWKNHEKSKKHIEKVNLIKKEIMQEDMFINELLNKTNRNINQGHNYTNNDNDCSDEEDDKDDGEIEIEGESGDGNDSLSDEDSNMRGKGSNLKSKGKGPPIVSSSDQEREEKSRQDGNVNGNGGISEEESDEDDSMVILESLAKSRTKRKNKNKKKLGGARNMFAALEEEEEEKNSAEEEEAMKNEPSESAQEADGVDNNDVSVVEETTRTDVQKPPQVKPKMTRAKMKKAARREQILQSQGSRSESQPRPKPKNSGGLDKFDADLDINHQCNVCGATYPSRTKLFQHVKERGHALSVESEVKKKGGKKGKGKI